MFKSKLKIKLLIMILATFLITFSLIVLLKSENFKIEKIEIINEDGKIPQSLNDYFNSFIGKNILLFNKKATQTILNNNPYIESIHIKRVFPKKLIFYLKKSPVNGILHYNDEKIGYAILINAKVFAIDEGDIDSLGKEIVRIECNLDSFNLLLSSDNISSFINEVNIIRDNYHYIDKVHYSNRGDVNEGLFEIELNGINALLRFRNFFSEEEFRNALAIANNLEKSNSSDKKNILDLYHGAIVERQ